MTHAEAKAALQESSAQIDVNEDSGTATINGTVSIEELQAILQLLEYSA